jgi:hypothetical protein
MIALIAGTGTLPVHACKSFLKNKTDFFVVSLFPEDNFVSLEKATPNYIEIIQQKFYKAQALLDLLKSKNTTHVMFIGKVSKQKLLARCKLDWLAIKLLASLTTKSDFSIMNKIELVLSKHNIKILHQNEILKTLFVEPGVYAGTLTPKIEACINFGLETAEYMSKCDIGQTVVVKDKMVLAVEAIEGTDKCIRRAIELGNGDVVVCKTVNPNHNTKFDLPTIGTETLRDIKRGDIQAIAWKSDKTFVANKDKFFKLAQELGITLVSV